MSSTIFVLNGPNLNLLGFREPQIYGAETLADIEGRLQARGSQLGFGLDFRQTNHEGVLIDWLQEARRAACGVILNPAAYTHTSVGLNDVVKAAEIPVVEVHISNIHARESFRHHSYVSPVARAIVVGFGTQGYDLALEGLARILKPAGHG